MDFERTSETPNKNDPKKTDFMRAELNPGLSTSTRERIAAYDAPFTSSEGTTNIEAQSRPSQLPLADSVQKPCILMGSAFILLGLVGFGIPEFFGLHLSSAHNFIHLFSGAIALYFGTRNSTNSALAFAFIFGGVYAVLGLTGFLFGSPGVMTMPMMSGNDPLLLPIARGSFELGLNDHILHLIISALFLIPAFGEMRRRDQIRAIRESTRY